MSANANIVDLVKGNSTLVRPRFSPGLLLRDDDLRVGVDYTRELSRLLFRSLFGCGVVCGLTVESTFECGKLIVTINPGVALNALGDPIHVPDPVPIKIDPDCGGKIPPGLWVILCHKEKCCAPRSAVCGCEEEDSASVCTREQEGFEIRLVKEEPRQDCACRCTELVIPEPKENLADRQRQGQADCWCADPTGCHAEHYMGKCDCKCCDPDCVVLALLTDVSRDKRYDNKVRKRAIDKGNPWIPNHSVRRFVRPVLMRDPVVYDEQHPKWDEDDAEQRRIEEAKKAEADAKAKEEAEAKAKAEAEAKAQAATDAQALRAAEASKGSTVASLVGTTREAKAGSTAKTVSPVTTKTVKTASRSKAASPSSKQPKPAPVKK